MKIIYLASFIMLLLLPVIARADGIDDVMNLVKQGNVTELSKLFADNVEVKVLSDDELDKTGASAPLTDFFAKHKPKAIKLLHKINSNPNYLYCVAQLTTEDGNFRVSFALSKSGDSMKVMEFQVEAAK